MKPNLLDYGCCPEYWADQVARVERHGQCLRLVYAASYEGGIRRAVVTVMQPIISVRTNTNLILATMDQPVPYPIQLLC